MKRGRKKKDQFEKIPDDVKAAMDAMDNDALRSRVSKQALMIHEQRQEMKADLQVQEAKAAYSESKKGYTESISAGNSQIEYADMLLRMRGAR